MPSLYTMQVLYTTFFHITTNNGNQDGHPVYMDCTQNIFIRIYIYIFFLFKIIKREDNGNCNSFLLSFLQE